MKVKSKGTGNRYANDLGGNHIERLGAEGIKPGLLLGYGKRFCETCRTRKPIKFSGGYGQIRQIEKAFKGWKCDDCKETKP